MGKLLEETLTDDTPGRNPAHAILQDPEPFRSGKACGEKSALGVPRCRGA